MEELKGKYEENKMQLNKEKVQKSEETKINSKKAKNKRRNEKKKKKKAELKAKEKLEEESEEDNFSNELRWCIEQINLGLLNKGISPEQSNRIWE